MRSSFTPLSLKPPQSQLVLHTLFPAPLLLSYTLRERRRREEDGIGRGERGRMGGRERRERKDGGKGEEREEGWGKGRGEKGRMGEDGIGRGDGGRMGGRERRE